MNGISLVLEPKPIWFGADDEIFDSTELASIFSRKERAALRFLLRPASRRMVQEMMIKHTSRQRVCRFVDGRKEFIDEDTLDQISFVDDMIDLIVLDWEGLLDEENRPIPCERKNKLALINAYPRLGTAILDAAGSAAVRHEQIKEESEKNLPGSPSGFTTGSGA